MFKEPCDEAWEAMSVKHLECDIEVLQKRQMRDADRPLRGHLTRCTLLQLRLFVASLSHPMQVQSRRSPDGVALCIAATRALVARVT